MTAEDLAERIQAFGIALEELVGVDCASSSSAISGLLINTHVLYHGYRKCLDVFSKILGSLLGPTKGLRMGKFGSNSKDRAKLDDWFRSLALDQLEELTFDDGHMRSLPTSALRLVPMLRVAKFRNCHFPPLNDAPALILPRLKHLELVALCLPNGDMERLLRGCTALEYLRL